MEAVRKRNIKPGYEFDKLFPRSEGDTKTIRKNANVSHTVEFIPKVVQETLNQTKQISKLLKGKTTYETCNNIWHFVYEHINYKKDQEGFEQIRSPSRAWHDRKQGVDCDCYSVFISSILTNLGVPHILRITKYHRDYFQHIYPIVPNDEKYITIDCVTDKFNYEVPFSEKKDYPMDLQYLNGFDGDGMEDLGKIIKKNMAKKNPQPPKANKKTAKKAAASIKKSAVSPTTPGSATSSVPTIKKKKGILKKVVNVVNKVNPATVLLRNGVLAAMKLNVKNVSQRLRWSYLSPQQAAEKNIDPVKFQKLVETRQKLEKIFFGAGGNVDNLKKAILGGKGNKDKAVSGLGMLPMMGWNNNMSEYSALKQLLGPEIYYSENVDGMEGFRGFGELGEPITLATVGAAMGVLAGIVAALKQIGDIFKTKEKGSEDFDESKTDAPENNVSVPANAATINPSIITPNTTLPIIDPSPDFSEGNSQNYSNTISKETVQTSENNLPSISNGNEMVMSNDNEINTSSSQIAPTENISNNNPSGNKESFWDKNKKWLKPVAIGVGGLTLIAIGFKLMGKKSGKIKSSPGHSLSGVSHKKRKKKKHKHHYKKSVALL